MVHGNVTRGLPSSLRTGAKPEARSSSLAAARSAVLATVISTSGRGWRNIIRRVLVKETVRLQQKAYVGRRHHRAVFGSRDVSVAEGVPEDNI